MRLKIVDIAMNLALHVRAKVREDVVGEYGERMKEGDRFPPVMVFRDQQEVLLLADGVHRLLAAERIGWTEIDAEVRHGTAADAVWYALAANRSHGTRMTPEDRRHAVVVAIRTFPERSQNLIADQAGCSRSYVEKVMAELEASQDDTGVSLPDRIIGRDGKSYPRNRLDRPGGRQIRRTPFDHLRTWWWRATAEQRAVFLDWTKAQERDGAYAVARVADVPNDGHGLNPETDSAKQEEAVAPCPRG